MEFKGFNRVLINESGEATTPLRAAEQGIYAEVGFLRKDGWSLGCSIELKDTAEEMWKDEWTHTIKKGETVWSPYVRSV